MTAADESIALGAWALCLVAAIALAHVVIGAHHRRRPCAADHSPRAVVVTGLAVGLLSPLAALVLAAYGAYLLITNPSTSRGGTTS